MDRTYSGEEFIKALSDNSLRAAIVREGMAKQDPDDHKAILFAEVDCNDWIRVPLASIEEVTFLAKVPCRDHEHPRVRIRFKEPEKDGAARLFADLARTAAMPIASVLDAGSSDEVVPGTIFQTQGSGAPTGGVGPLDRCGCLKYATSVEWVYIRYAPGRFLPVPIVRRTCTHYECDLK